MPSLAGLPSNLPSLIIMLIGGFGPDDELLRRQLTSAVRLVNLSVEEYERARGLLEETLKGGQAGFNAFLHATDHLELCVVTVHRAMEACSAVWRHPGMASYLDSRKEETRLARKHVESVEDRLEDVRDAITHIAEWIAQGKIAEGQPHVLSVSDDGRTARVGSQSVSLYDLGRAIKHLHALAAVFSQYRSSKRP